MKRKHFLLVLVFAMVLSLAACGSSKTKDSRENNGKKNHAELADKIAASSSGVSAVIMPAESDEEEEEAESEEETETKEEPVEASFASEEELKKLDSEFMPSDWVLKKSVSGKKVKYTTFYTYDEDWKLIAVEKYRDKDNVLVKANYYFYTNTFITTERTLSHSDSKGDTETELKYFYNTKGQLLKKLETVIGTSEEITYLYEYDEKGNLSFDSRTSTLTGSEGCVKNTYEYDEKGFLVKQIYDASYGNPTVFKYVNDEKGNYIEQYRGFGEDLKLVEKVSRSYDEQGRQTGYKNEGFDSDGIGTGGGSYTYSYDAWGNLEKEYSGKLDLTQNLIEYTYQFTKDSFMEDAAMNAPENTVAVPEVGETFFFGEYEQDMNLNNGKEPIEWIVIDKQEDKALAVSKDVLDVCPASLVYAYEGDLHWKGSNLRYWLNSTFYTKAFTNADRQRIVNTYIDEDDYSCNDNVFVLSTSEAYSYFGTKEGLRSTWTAFAEARGVECSTFFLSSTWFTREPGLKHFSMRCEIEKTTMTSEKIGVRPAIWINYEAGAGVKEGPATRSDMANNDNPMVGDTVFFGQYEQDDDSANGKEAIEWVVLKKEEGKVMLLSRFAIDGVAVSSDEAVVEWAESDLRKWSNDEFINEAFSESERNGLLENEAQDKVFLLKTEELYLIADASVNDNICPVTKYAAKKLSDSVSFDWNDKTDIYRNYIKSVDTNGICTNKKVCVWWIDAVRKSKAVYFDHGYTRYTKPTDINAFRPAIWVSVDALKEAANHLEEAVITEIESNVEEEASIENSQPSEE